MDNLIGILATIVLVGTVCTLIFAIAAYILARRRTRDYIRVANMVPDPITPEKAEKPEPEQSNTVVHEVIEHQTGVKKAKPRQPQIDLEKEQTLPDNPFDMHHQKGEKPTTPQAGEVFRWK